MLCQPTARFAQSFWCRDALSWVCWKYIHLCLARGHFVVQTGLALCTIVCLGVVSMEECMRMVGSLAEPAQVVCRLQMVVLRKLRLHLTDIAIGEVSLLTDCPRLDARMCFEAMSVVAWKAGLCKQVERFLKI